MTKGDKILIILVLILSISSLGFIKKKGLNMDDKYISIQVDGEEVKKIYFDKSVEGKEFPIETEYGYNLVKVEKDSVRVIDASCPDKLDVKQGSISIPGQVIVCLPNKLVVEIVGEKLEDDIDIMNY